MRYNDPEIMITKFSAMDMIVTSDVVQSEYDAYISYSYLIDEESKPADMGQ